MARGRNERATRATSTSGGAAEEEEERDLRWHPTEDEFVSPLSRDQWAELLGDETFAETDAARAVRDLHEYGEPATFQQLSIRYRTTMGRYRRWLGDAAREAGQRYGIPVPQHDQLGMEEWWPLLYRMRATGKPGAGIYEMSLRPEVEEAFELLAEKERLAKRAENARQLQRIEQLERAKQEQRRQQAAANEAASEARPLSARAHDSAQEQDGGPASPVEPLPSPVDSARRSAASQALPQTNPPASSADANLSAVDAFLKAVASKDVAASGHRFGLGAAAAPAASSGNPSVFDAAEPVDYALRYAERLREALVCVREGAGDLSLAAVARELQDPSVEPLQTLVNGERIPDFAYVDKLGERLYVHVGRLEATDTQAPELPLFATLQEIWGTHGVSGRLADEPPRAVVYVVDDSDARRTGTIVCFSALRCALLTRIPVAAEAKRSESAELDAFVRMVEELDGFCSREGVARLSTNITAAQWDALAEGKLWPGAVLA